MSLTTLPAVLTTVKTALGGVTGIRESLNVPPEQWISGGVYAVAYPATGTYSEIATGREHGLHTLHLMVATPRGTSFRSDWERVIGLGDVVAAAILGALLQTVEIRYTYGELEWGGQQLLGWRFDFDVQLTGSL